MNTSQFSLDYAEYEALVAGRLETALSVVGQTPTVGFSEPGNPAQPQPRAPRASIDNHQQLQDFLLQTLAMRSWANALLPDVHPLR